MEKQNCIETLIRTYLGLPYHWGGSNPLTGFDCSGLVVEILTAMGRLPHKFDTTAQGLSNRSDTIYEPKKPKFGDLCFYGKHLDRVTHVGFCLNDELMVEAGGGGSKTTTYREAARTGACVRIRPIKYRSDFLECGQFKA